MTTPLLEAEIKRLRAELAEAMRQNTVILEGASSLCELAAARAERGEAERERLRAELAQWEHDIKFWGIVEIAVRNVSVFDYMKHWEGRAERAEAECDQLKAMLERRGGGGDGPSSTAVDDQFRSAGEDQQ